MGKVIPIGGVTQLDIPVDDILENLKGELETVIILGTDVKGKLFFAASTGDAGEMLWYIENFKRMLLDANYEE